ncbi:ankyrin repeat and MYND domain-containing protein 1 [Boleophthalmus pectinirostris]|uniref:ankyrin repeat and MYND domain-containing protein 1 n=1 Tax=Boleophthalmus pectinirostris TaxID=150288 RepID=UPI00243110E3|nr:ankyrin repeat and MYND domain-containing protein 1 [Boleophthalmus pectinirostris]
MLPPRGDEQRPGPRVQERSDGSRYEGEFRNGLKHGTGRFTWKDGQFYEGSFYKEARHGHGVLCSPSGDKFIGKFYLSREEGYGQHLFSSGSHFQGLYHVGCRLGPGVLSYPDGRQDVGLWLDERLIRLCSAVGESFTLRDLPGYAAYLDSSATAEGSVTWSQTNFKYPETHVLAVDDCFIFPAGLEEYSTDWDNLPLPPKRRHELDKCFYGDEWEPDPKPYLGYKRDPLSALPVDTRMQANVFKHRRQGQKQSWDVGAVLSLSRRGFGPKGPLEVSSEQLILHASRGEKSAVSQIVWAGQVHPDVADARGNTALIAATVNCCDEVIERLLDNGVDIDKLNAENMSALAVCHVLFYPFHSLYTTALQDNLTDTDTQAELVKSEEEEAVENTQNNKDRQAESRQRSAETLSRTDFTHSLDAEETVHKTPAMKTEHRERLKTLELLLERGADPNACRVPVPVLFVAVMARDVEGVRRLLLHGARTDAPLPPQRKGLYPLHVAAALPGSAGPKITELLLQTITDPDARACDEDQTNHSDREIRDPVRSTVETKDREGGSTALHVACRRNTDYQNVSKIVALLLARGARTDLLWSGHSPLSLAIASGNETVTPWKELLRCGADPNVPLGDGVGSALCVLSDVNHSSRGNRQKLLDLLVKNGADVSMPVLVDGVEGTALDYAHFSFNQFQEAP